MNIPDQPRTVTLTLEHAQRLLRLDPGTSMDGIILYDDATDELRALVAAHTCSVCDGEGTIHTGIEESPSSVCNACNGTGQTPMDKVRTRLESLYGLEPGQEGQFRHWYANRQEGDHGADQRVKADNTEQAILLLDFALSFALCNRDHSGTRNDVKKAQAHLAQLKAFMAVDGLVLDFDKADWESILKAASENTWMPPEYMRNEWVSDVCAFLRNGPAAFAADGEQPTDNEAFERYWYAQKATAIGANEAKLYFSVGAAHARAAKPLGEMAGYFSYCHDKEKWLQQKSKGAEFNHLFTKLYKATEVKS